MLLVKSPKNQLGLFITTNDYVAENLSYSNQKEGLKYTIKLNQTFNVKYIQVLNDNQKIKFNKDPVFG